MKQKNPTQGRGFLHPENSHNQLTPERVEIIRAWRFADVLNFEHAKSGERKYIRSTSHD